MKIALAQLRSYRGEIEKNIHHHIQIIELAAQHHSNIIIFPELSLTAYEPSLASELAMTIHDERLDVFQDFSNQLSIVICVGMPRRVLEGVEISLIIFEPGKDRSHYSKNHLHSDEDAFFIASKELKTIQVNQENIGFLICYEIAVKEHIENVFNQNISCFIASAAKSKIGIEQAFLNLKNIATTYKCPVLIVNGIGPSNNFINAGSTAVWDRYGELLSKLDESQEGILLYDVSTEQTQNIQL